MEKCMALMVIELAHNCFLKLCLYSTDNDGTEIRPYYPFLFQIKIIFMFYIWIIVAYIVFSFRRLYLIRK